MNLVRSRASSNRRPAATSDSPDAPVGAGRYRLRSTLWGLGIFAMVWNAKYLLSNQDIAAVNVFWRAGRAVLEGRSPYDLPTVTGSFVDSPSALLFLAPMAVMSLRAFQVVSFFVDVACLVGMVLVLFRAFGGRWATAAGAVAVFVMAQLSVVKFVLTERNWEPELLLGFAAVVFFAVKRQWPWVACLLGVSFALKPILLPLALLLVVQRRWQELAVAVSIPLALNAIGYLIVPGAHLFVSEVLPFLARGQSPDLQPANVSVAGFLNYRGVAPPLVVLSRLAVLVLVSLLVWQRVLRWIKDVADAVVLTEIASLLVLGFLLCFSYSFSHYAIYCMPALLTVVDDRSSLRGLLYGVAVVLLTGMDGALPLLGQLVLLAAFAWGSRKQPGDEWVSDRRLASATE